MLENSITISGTNPSFPGRAIDLVFNAASPVTVHLVPTGFVDRVVQTYVYPSTATVACVLVIQVGGFEAVRISMQPNDVFRYDVALESLNGVTELLVNAQMSGGDVNGRVSGYVIRGGGAKAHG